MNILKYSMLVTVVLSVINITACETIASYLPDKEKDYHYHTELPPLELPPDLQEKVEKKPQGAASKSRVEPVKSDAAAISTDPVTVRMVTYDAGSVRIQIDSSLKEAWPVVGKAISRNLIEVTDRNKAEGVYFVHYDPDVEKKYEDGSIGDEFEFVFGDNPRQGKEYHVRLAEDGKLTEVMVADENDIPLSEGNGLKLLNSLYETIKADQEKKVQE